MSLSIAWSLIWQDLVAKIDGKDHERSAALAARLDQYHVIVARTELRRCGFRLALR